MFAYIYKQTIKNTCSESKFDALISHLPSWFYSWDLFYSAHNDIELIADGLNKLISVGGSPPAWITVNDQCPV